MDDFVINVRQIGQYPIVGGVGPNDLVLIQQGGLGGPYASVSASVLVATALENAPDNPTMSVPLGLVWIGGAPVPDASFGFDGTRFYFNVSSGVAQVHVPYLVADAAIVGGEVLATQPWVGEQLDSVYIKLADQVSSFNGRNGDVLLNWSDVYTALMLDPCDPIATQSWVNNEICKAIPDFYYSTPLVYTFNGRVGDVFLRTDDVNDAYAFGVKFGVYPTAPSPALGDASNRIATTAFVDESLEEWATEINNGWNAADFELLNLIQTQYAPLNSPQFTGVPTGPTPPVGSTTSQLATTAFVMNAIVDSTTGVVSFNTRTGAITFEAQDLQDVGGAFLNSPIFTGTPAVPLAPAADNSNQIASTAWVQQEISAISAGVTSWNGRSGIVNLQAADLTLVGGALLASPAFSGNPTAPTQVAGTSNTTLATTAFVAAAVLNSVASFNGRTGAVTFQANDISAVGGALLASPAFTGTPTAPTAVAGTSTTQLATTAFVMAALGGGGLVSSWNGRTGTVTLTAADVAAVGAAFMTQSATAPASPTVNILWYDTNSGQMFVWNGSVWAAINAG